MQDSTSKQIATLRNQGGYFRASDYGLIEIYGKDAAAFLQDKTTNDVAGLQEYQSQLSCLLDRKAHIKGIFQLYRKHDSFRLIAERSQIESILAHLETSKFNDKVDFLNLSETGEFFAMEGPESSPSLFNQQSFQGCLLRFDQDLSDNKMWGLPVHIFRKSITGEDGYFFWLAKSDIDEFVSHAEPCCQRNGLIKLESKELETARIEAGLPKFGVDFSKENLLPETGLDALTVSYSKGCFLGQEVLSRIKNNGAPSKALVGLIFNGNSNYMFPINSQIKVSDKEVGRLKSSCFSPTIGKTVALALLSREFRTPNRQLNFSIADQSVVATSSLLPFYKAPSSSERATKLYQTALYIFASQSSSESAIESIKLLEKAIVLAPFFEDAYESLGVILSKSNKITEAIAVMNKLAELNPQSIMAHTNLSIFYMQQGLKEKAEEEKSISMSLRIELAAKQASFEKHQNAEMLQKQRSNLERLEMFQKVLAIDSEDFLANYGLGSCYVDLGQNSEAIPYLIKALKSKPSYTAAYLTLAKAYQEIDKYPEANKILETGIEVAAKHGEIELLKLMQKNLASIANSIANY
jgi:folate-binding protein YgfZ